MLFLFISTILFLRLVNHELPVFELAPTSFILLAPIGILIVDFTLIAKHSANLVPLALIASISLWGFGLWALAVNLLLILRYLRQEMPFFLGCGATYSQQRHSHWGRLLCHTTSNFSNHWHSTLRS
ncbi:SLAC1 family transporter [Archaeoglobus sp.]